MANSMRIFSAVFMIVLSLQFCQHCKSDEDNPKKTAAFYLFGDSYLDVGNNNYINTTAFQQANFWPYGESYFNYPTGRFSDGLLVSDFIGEYAKLGLIKAYLDDDAGAENEYLKGLNFASGGAGALAETFQGEVLSLRTQLKYFKNLESRMRTENGRKKTKVILSDAVFLFSIGTNDYITLFFSTDPAVSRSRFQSQHVAMVIGNLTEVIHEIYKIGGRKFAFMNLGPLGCLPGFRMLTSTGTCFRPASHIAKLHNRKLSKSLETIDKQLKDFKYSLYDYHTALSQIINHPSKYESKGLLLKEAKTSCCGSGRLRGNFSCGGTRVGMKEYEVCADPREYVFWDSAHLTQPVYEQMSIEMWNGNSSIIAPYNLSTLFRCN